MNANYQRTTADRETLKERLKTLKWPCADEGLTARIMEETFREVTRGVANTVAPTLEASREDEFDERLTQQKIGYFEEAEDATTALVSGANRDCSSEYSDNELYCGRESCERASSH
ncbi:hypothetical protein LTR17_013252 [Elasticomyces elasticus]|nr:hypothetical protein LTR17_013252 [Elasticomyces elasticus]